MNNGFKTLLLASAIVALPLQAAAPKAPAKKAAQLTLLQRAKRACPALAKVALFGTASSFAMSWSLKNFEVFMPTKSAELDQIRKTGYYLVGPIVAAIAYELLAKESPEEDEYRKEEADAPDRSGSDNGSEASNAGGCGCC